MAKKFVNVSGLHNVFATLDDFNSGTIKSEVSNKVDTNTILYITCDSNDYSVFGAPYYEGCTLTYASKKPYAISGLFVKTINNIAVDSSGNVNINTDIPVVSLTADITAPLLYPNRLYQYTDALADSYDVLLYVPTSTSVAYIYMLEFYVTDTLPEITWPGEIKWVSSTNMEINKKYQVAILNNVGLITSVSIE